MDGLTQLKNLLVHLTGFTRPELHLIVGALLFVMVFALVRRPWVALAVVAIIAFGNEANDYRRLVPVGPDPRIWSVFWADTVEDVLWTLSIPVMLTVAIALMRLGRRR